MPLVEQADQVGGEGDAVDDRGKCVGVEGVPERHKLGNRTEERGVRREEALHGASAALGGTKEGLDVGAGGEMQIGRADHLRGAVEHRLGTRGGDGRAPRVANE